MWILDSLMGRPLVVKVLVVTHDCVATFNSNTVITFADDIAVVGLITDHNNLLLIVGKTDSGLKVDFGKKQGTNYAPLNINGSFKYLGTDITKSLTQLLHTD